MADNRNLATLIVVNTMLGDTPKDALVSFERVDAAKATLREWQSQLEKLLDLIEADV
jgi:hypothetical protein